MWAMPSLVLLLHKLLTGIGHILSSPLSNVVSVQTEYSIRVLVVQYKVFDAVAQKYFVNTHS